jgi:MerR family mercuric resistance operon transcriptional regulator
MSTRHLSSGELAREAGLNLETLRYYERRGLLPPPSRAESGHRRYDPESVSLLRHIKRAQGLGFTLAEIRDLIRGLESPKAVCDDICRAIEAKLSQLDRDLAMMRERRKRLQSLRAACPRTRPLRECPVIVELKQPTQTRRRR